jgi:hypothetical protein
MVVEDWAGPASSGEAWGVGLGWKRDNRVFQYVPRQAG